LANGQQVVAVALQKAASIMGLPAVVGPDAANLRPVERPVRDTARRLLAEAARAIERVRTALAEPPPFGPGETPPNPWAIRGNPRAALPDPEFVDGPQHGTLTATAVPQRAQHPRWNWAGRRGVLGLAVAMLAVGILLCLALLI
jgi:hypothetical protein